MARVCQQQRRRLGEHTGYEWRRPDLYSRTESPGSRRIFIYLRPAKDEKTVKSPEIALDHAAA